MLKLSKLMVAVTVYRGVGGTTLPKSFFQKNKMGLRGGIEYAFTSTTPDRSVAVQYAGGKASTVIGARMGFSRLLAKSNKPDKETATPIGRLKGFNGN